MPKTLTLNRPARCADPQCGAELHPGDRVVIYGRLVFGRDCHAKRMPPEPVRESLHDRIARYAREQLRSGGNP